VRKIKRQVKKAKDEVDDAIYASEVFFLGAEKIKTALETAKAA
jgi:hypothetical protein